MTGLSKASLVMPRIPVLGKLGQVMEREVAPPEAVLLPPPSPPPQEVKRKVAKNPNMKRFILDLNSRGGLLFFCKSMSLIIQGPRPFIIQGAVFA